MDFVMIYGPPGVGKLTTATELARMTGYKLFDNHVSIDWALGFFEFGSEPFWRLVGQFREDVIEECARAGLNLVSTFVYAHGQDLLIVTKWFEKVAAHGGRVCLVQLTCDREALEARVVAADRSSRGKLATVEGLQETLEKYDLSTPIPGRENLRVDNSLIPPQETARRIAEHFGFAATGAA